MEYVRFDHPHHLRQCGGASRRGLSVDAMLKRLMGMTTAAVAVS